MISPLFHTLNDALEYAEKAFLDADLYYGHGTDNAWDEAVALTFCALEIPFSSEPSIVEKPLTVEESEKLITLYQNRLTDRTPVPYLTQQAWFYGLPFYVDERVIIPRSPIAELIEHQFSPWIDPTKVNRILDLCCGSACIAIACASAFPKIEIDGADISADVLDVAHINVAGHQLTQRMQLFESDLFSAIPAQQYDVIVSNPPYVNAEDLASMPAEYQHEPTLALAAGDDGLSIVHRILASAADYLTDHGILIVEVGNSAEALIAAYPDMPFTWLEFEFGGDGVFLLTKQQLLDQ